MWQLLDLIQCAKEVSVESLSGHWIPARPMTSHNSTMLGRLQSAWYVLTGKADAVIWSDPETYQPKTPSTNVGN